MGSTYIGLEALKRRADIAVRETLEEVGEEFRAKVAEDEPLLSGEMEGSTEITPVMGGGVRWWRKLTVGAYYSVWQHEKTWYHHDHGRAKFVRDPLIIAVTKMRMALARAARRSF
jgi:hypothetical protein